MSDAEKLIRAQIALMFRFLKIKSFIIKSPVILFPSEIPPEKYRLRVSFILNIDNDNELLLTYSGTGTNGFGYVFLNGIRAELPQLEVAHQEMKTLSLANLEQATRKTLIPRIDRLLSSFHKVEFLFQ